MSLIALMYHDIESAPTRRRYSFTLEQFREHLQALKASAPGAPAVPAGPQGEPSGWAVTFDDGHPGWLAAGEALAELGWKGVFFVISGAVGKTGGLDRAGVRRLSDLGHVIGSHSVDHPLALSSREPDYILDQWSRSRAALEEITGREVLTASVPGGFYSGRVARAAAAAGLKHLFTSEPVAESWLVDGCRVYGRFTLVNGTSPESVARLAAGSRVLRLRQYVGWNLKKAAKTVFLRPYLAVRGRLHPS